MKTGQIRKLVMVASLSIGGIFMLSSCDKSNDNNNTGKNYTVSGNASGSQMVPTVTGSGSATISGTYNSNTRVLTYTSNWTNLTGAPTTASFYSGATGTAGAAIGSSWTLGTGLSGTGSVSSSITLSADQAAQLLAGTMYYAYSTATHPNGEVRGQLTATAQ
jgi:CHRD domain-containing protein